MSEIQVEEAGPWEYGIALTGTDAGRAYVESNDFTHDARLYINGDFKGTKQKLAYAKEIARRLNSHRQFDEIFNMARICAEKNMNRADDCGNLARMLLDALNSLKV